MVATSANNGNNGNNKRIDDLPEEVVIDIIARLAPKSVVSFKLVCKQYKSLTESAFFHDFYRRNFYASSSSNCSILHGVHHLLLKHSSLELLKLDLPSSSSSSLGDSFFASVLAQEKIRVAACADGLVLLGLNEEDMKKTRYYVGNPVLQQWIQLPPLPPSQDLSFLLPGFSDTGLVTRMHNGALLGYKVVRLHNETLKLPFSPTWSFEIFSSDTGEWSVVRRVFCPGHGVSVLRTSNSVSLNGKLHWLDHSRRIIVHDFFSHDDQLRTICLPAPMQGTEPRLGMYFSPTSSSKIICTTSQGYFVFVDVGFMQEVKSYNVRVWRLKCDSWNWEKAWEINMASVGVPRNCVPMAVNFFDIHIIYLWDLDLKCFLAFNLLANTISYGTRKDGVYKGNSLVFQDPMAVDGVVYKEDIFCFEQHPCLFHFVPSLQVVPT